MCASALVRASRSVVATAQRLVDAGVTGSGRKGTVECGGGKLGAGRSGGRREPVQVEGATHREVPIRWDGQDGGT